MRKIVLFFSCLGLVFPSGMQASAGNPDISFRQIFKEFPASKGLGPQGAASFGDLLFQFYDGAPAIGVFSISSGKTIAEIPLEGHRTWHCNNVCVSSFYYGKGDAFPLLYASQENRDEHRICVFRISGDVPSLKADLVQTIVLPEPREMGVWYPNCALDLQSFRLYVTGYSRESWNKKENGNAIQLLGFSLPMPFEPEVKLGTADIVSRDVFDFRIATQGAAIRNGRLYQCYGMKENPALRCYDLASGAMQWNVELGGTGFFGEPEGLFFNNDELCIVNGDGRVFRSSLSCPWDIPAKLRETAPGFASGQRKKLVCMDLDATLTQHRTPLEKRNRDALTLVCNHFDAVMVCAGNVPRVRRQMEDFPIAIVGNYGMQIGQDAGGKLVITRQLTIPADTAFFLSKTDYLRKKYGYTSYKGDPVEFHAAGMVTFSLLGNKGGMAEKLVFDPDKAKRRAMYPEVLEIFKDYSVFIGGSSSFDFTPKQFNKYDASLDYARERGYGLEDIIFIGDDFDDGGGDSHVRIKGMDYIRIYDYRQFPEMTAPLFLPQ